ncbi:MAG: T9SS type A sorting domain-containing protein, partial [Elusimicrobiota bacterium]
GYYDTPGFACGVAISGNYAYVADWDSGLQVIDIANPASPQLAGSYDTPDWAKSVAISGNYAYVADWDSGLCIVNVTDPASPRFAGSYDTPGRACGVAISGNYAYVADDFSRIPVLDISSPANIRLVGTYYTKGTSCQLVLNNGYLYSADVLAGLSVIDLDDIRTGIANNSSSFKSSNVFLHNYPNPFNLNTTFKFNYNPGLSFQLSIFDISGQLVQRIDGIRSGKVNWNAGGCVSGYYLAKLKVGNKVHTKRIMLVR